MSTIPIYNTLKTGALAIFIALISACVYDPYYAGTPRPVPLPHYYPYDYYYYPGVRVYFHVTSGYYYYPSGKVWIRTKVLPPHIRLNPRERSKIRIDDDVPYKKHDQHHRKYKPRKDKRPTPRMDKEERKRHLEWYDRSKKQQPPRGEERKSKKEKRRDKRDGGPRF